MDGDGDQIYPKQIRFTPLMVILHMSIETVNEGKLG